jgi:excisionase family DNA binding protein
VIEKTTHALQGRAGSQPLPPADEPSRQRPFFTKRSLCAYLVISPSTLDRLVRAGRLAAHRIGGQVRFDPDEVEEFIAATKE